MVEVTHGDLFNSDCDVLVNTVNCVGVMGKGIAKQFKEKYPEMFDDYKKKCKDGFVKPGLPYMYQDVIGNRILNFPTKNHWRGESKFEYIEDGLKWIAENYKEYNIESMAIPALGCGNGGLDWKQVGPLMYQELEKTTMHCRIYAPLNIDDSEMSREYLCSPIVKNSKRKPTTIELNPNWMLIVRAIQLIGESGCPSINRETYQVMSFMMTRGGINLGFRFELGKNHEIYSIGANNALNKIIAKGIIIETPDDSKHLYVREDLTIDETEYDNKELKLVNSIVDLFNRIQSVEQAKLISLIVHCYDSIIQDKGDKHDHLIEYVRKLSPHNSYSREMIVQAMSLLGFADPS